MLLIKLVPVCIQLSFKVHNVHTHTHLLPSLQCIILMSLQYARCRERERETHTHNHFMALLDFVEDYPGEPAPER